MSLALANTFYRTSDLLGVSNATCFQQVESDVEAEGPQWIPDSWESVVVAPNPTVGAVEQGYELRGESCFVTYLMPLRGKTRYQVIDMVSAPVTVAQEDLEQPAPILSLKPWSRIRVRARVTIRRGRLSLVVPDVLEEAE